MKFVADKIYCYKNSSQHEYILYKLVSKHMCENIIIYECKITLTNHPNFYTGEIIMIDQGFLYENSEELTDELKVELL